MINYIPEKCFLGDALTVDNGYIKLTVTLSVGPRIIALSAGEGGNVMFNDCGGEICKDVSAQYGEGEKWHIYGGHRMWLSPEDETTYYPDNSPVHYLPVENGVILLPQPWKKVDITPVISIEFTGKTTFKIIHKIINNGEKRKLCIWALSVFKPNGKMTFEFDKTDTGYLANRNLVLWHYTDMYDSRIKIDNDKIVLQSSDKASKPMKIGCYKQDVDVMYEIDGTTVRKSWSGAKGEEYPDFSCNFESYTSNLIHEIESLSPMKIIETGGELSHTEYWSIERKGG